MKLPLFWIKLTNFEYWTWYVFYLPLLPYFVYLAIKHRSLTMFTAANPSIFLGGLFGESKNEIFKLIPQQYLPKTVFFPQGTSINKIVEVIENQDFNFPLILKPDVGERGNGVEKMNNLQDVFRYFEVENGVDKSAKNIEVAMLLQEYVDFEIELGVFYYRKPNENTGVVSSIVGKEFLQVQGNGSNTIRELLEQNDRARFQLEVLRQKWGTKLDEILANGEVWLIEPIGNHCRGTKFVDCNSLINKQLHEIFDKISKQIEGFYYGRFDIRVKSLEDLYAGTNIRIMELNGVSSEPGHIYHPNYSLLKAYKELAQHWGVAAEISAQNISNGKVQEHSAWEVWQAYQRHKK
jgi:hypothetical protein